MDERIRAIMAEVLRLPQENYQKLFDTFIAWARFGNLFAYDEDTGLISLQ